MRSSRQEGSVTLSEYMQFALTGVKGVGQGRAAGAPLALRRVDLGKLVLPTGRVCVTDAYSADQWPPLNVIVAPGEYSTELVLADIEKGSAGGYGGVRGAFVVSTFTDQPVAGWTGVTAVASAPPAFMPDKPNVVVQEGALGLFSPEAGDQHFALLRKDFDGHVATLRGLLHRDGQTEWLSYSPVVGSAKVIIVEGGFGDGEAQCFAGFTQEGRLARLVIDYRVAFPIPAGGE